MSLYPKEVLTKINALTHSWGMLCPDKTFYGLTFEQFKEVVNASHEVRAELAELSARTRAALVRRHHLDAMSMDVVNGVINSIKGDPLEGEDGALYVSLGYVRKSDRAPRRSRLRVMLAAQRQQSAGAESNAKPEDTA